MKHTDEQPPSKKARPSAKQSSVGGTQNQSDQQQQLQQQQQLPHHQQLLLLQQLHQLQSLQPSSAVGRVPSQPSIGALQCLNQLGQLTDSSIAGLPSIGGSMGSLIPMLSVNPSAAYYWPHYVHALNPYTSTQQPNPHVDPNDPTAFMRFSGEVVNPQQQSTSNAGGGASSSSSSSTGMPSRPSKSSAFTKGGGLRQTGPSLGSRGSTKIGAETASASSVSSTPVVAAVPSNSPENMLVSLSSRGNTAAAAAAAGQSALYCQRETCWARTAFPNKPHRHVRVQLEELLNQHKYKCPFPGCDARPMKRRQNLQLHIQKHKGHNIELPPPREAAWKKEIPGIVNVYECPRANSPSCKHGKRGRGFKTWQNLVEHAKSAHDDCEIACQFAGCKNKFSNHATLQKHITAVHPPTRTKCPYCDKDYKRKQGMQRHVRKDHSDKPVPT